MNKIKLLLTYYIDKINKISHNEKTIDEKMEEQDRPTIPARDSKDEIMLYEELLKLLKPVEKKK